MFGLKKTLRIAQIAPIVERVPPRKYGGTERVVSALTEELIKRGHEVTLFASGDSITSAKLEYVIPKSLRDAKIQKTYGINDSVLLHLSNVYKRYGEFDIIHDHNTYSIPTAEFSKTPVIITLHGAINKDSQKLLESVSSPYLVSISKAQVANHPFIPITENIYNGLPMEYYPFGKKDKNYLLYVGRICMQKGAHIAIDVAKKAKMPLIIAAKLDDVDVPYFEKYVKNKIDGKQIKWIGEVDEKKRNNLMKNATCLLHPITWMEPFGLSLIEAMTCGCPVVAFGKGSIPEVINDGKTGFVVNNISEMVSAVKKVKKLDRAICRNYSLSNFNERIMADRYEDLYYRIIREEERTKEFIQNNLMLEEEQTIITN